MAKRSERIAAVTDADLREQLEGLETLRKSLSSGKSAEAKSLEKAIEQSASDEVREVLQNRLKEIESEADVSLEDVVSSVEGLGLSPIKLIEMGASKWVNQKLYAYENPSKGKSDEEGTDDEGEDEESDSDEDEDNEGSPFNV